MLLRPLYALFVFNKKTAYRVRISDWSSDVCSSDLGDRIQLTKDQPAAGLNRMEAVVVGEEFVGATAVVYLEGPGGIEIKAQKSHDELAELDLSFDSRVWLSWRPEAGHILPGE